MSSESVILCEGYHDRAFWQGWLLHLGCIEPRSPDEPGGRRHDVIDPWGTLVTGRGQYGYQSCSGEFIRVMPCHGIKKVPKQATKRLAERETRPLSNLVINVDSDEHVDSPTPGTAGAKRQSVLDLARKADPDLIEADDGGLLLFDGATRVSLLTWSADDEPGDGLPEQQTLERLVCAAIIAAHADRGPAVQRWLDQRPDPPSAGPKEFAWSYMAGWEAEGGCEFFYQSVWQDAGIASELEKRLRASGAWDIAEALAR